MTSNDEYNDLEGDSADRPVDAQQKIARVALEEYFNKHAETVFFSRQIEVSREDTHFHWITNRALRELIADGTLRGERRNIGLGNTINLIWHQDYRFYRRSATRLIRLVEEYSHPDIGGAIGLHGEFLVLEAFARNRFLMSGRETNQFRGSLWDETSHDLDFIFERDGKAYGVEVKNTLGYMDYSEFKLKIQMCRKLGLKPLFVARMLPRTWMSEVASAGGFALILKYQLYPWTHRPLARRVAQELGLPVDSPKAIEQGTMSRFLQWHDRKSM